MTSRILEMINGSLAILAAELIAICVIYCMYQGINLRMSWRDWIVALPLGIAVALALLTKNVGDEIRYLTVWWWRFTTDGVGPMSEVQLLLLILGSTITALGMLWLIYRLTQEWFGVRILAFCAAMVAVYLGGTAVFHGV